MSNRQRFHWVELVMGLTVGLLGGLFYAWLINPVTYTDVGPDRLKPEDQATYIVLIGEAYLHDHDLGRARARLSLLGESDTANLVAQLADQTFTHGGDPEEVRALSVLAEALSAQTLAGGIFSGTQAPTAGIQLTVPSVGTEVLPPPAITPTPNPGLTLLPTLEPTVAFPPTQETGFDLVQSMVICEDDYPAGIIEVYVQDMSGLGVAGIEVRVEWEGGQDTFFTGLKPEIDPGYADFKMEARRIYTLTLVGLSEPVLGVDSATCTTPSGQLSTPTYRLIFAAASEGD